MTAKKSTTTAAKKPATKKTAPKKNVSATTADVNAATGKKSSTCGCETKLCPCGVAISTIQTLCKECSLLDKDTIPGAVIERTRQLAEDVAEIGFDAVTKILGDPKKSKN